MPQLNPKQRRDRLREVIGRNAITSPASVFDAISARLAAACGFEYSLMGGSIASHVVLGAPDLNVLTLTEFAEQSRRICRASDLPVIVDADHGYGNALNVRRTVEELETAGVAALTIEDTVLPRPYGGEGRDLISRDEFRDKLRAAVDARSDPSFIVIARTDCMGRGTDETAARVCLATEAGVDCIFLTGKAPLDLLAVAHTATHLPFIVNDRAPPAKHDLLAAGVRILYEGHQPFFVMVQALYEAYKTQRSGDSTDLRSSAASSDVRGFALAEDEYAALVREFLG